jgi:hypothetical protein
MIRKAGRPSKATLAERARLKAKAAEQDRFRTEMERKIAQGRVQLIDWDTATVRSFMGETLPDDCLVAAPPIPDKILAELFNALMNDKRTPRERRRDQDRALLGFAASMKQHLVGRGLSAAEAEEQVAAARGWKDRETLQRMLRKARARLRRAAAK